METWNERLSKALAESDYNKNSLAGALGVSAPTVSAWVAAAGITPAKTIGGDNLLRVCRVLNVRPEWVMFREGQMRRPGSNAALEEAFSLLASLPEKAQQMVIDQIKQLADLTSEKVNHVTAEKSDTIRRSVFGEAGEKTRRALERDVADQGVTGDGRNRKNRGA